MSDYCSLFSQTFYGLLFSYLTITDVTSYVHHKLPVSFLLYIATKKTCQINQIITVNSSMNAPISETYSSQKNNSCTPCVPMFEKSRQEILTRKSNSKILTQKSNSKIQLENPTRNPNSVNRQPLVSRILNKKEAFDSGRFLRLCSSSLIVLFDGIHFSPIFLKVKSMKTV